MLLKIGLNFKLPANGEKCSIFYFEEYLFRILTYHSNGHFVKSKIVSHTLKIKMNVNFS